MMIYKRRIARDRRMEKHNLLKDWRDDLRHEREFEDALARSSPDGFERVYDDIHAWGMPVACSCG